MVNPESIILGSSAVLFTFLAGQVRGPYREWADSQINVCILTFFFAHLFRLMPRLALQKILGVLNASRQEHTSAVEARITDVSEMKDSVDVTKALFAMSKVCLSPTGQPSNISRSKPISTYRRPPNSSTRLSSSSRRLPSLQKSRLHWTLGFDTKPKPVRLNRPSSSAPSSTKFSQSCRSQRSRKTSLLALSKRSRVCLALLAVLLTILTTVTLSRSRQGEEDLKHISDHSHIGCR